MNEELVRNPGTRSYTSRRLVFSLSTYFIITQFELASQDTTDKFIYMTHASWAKEVILLLAEIVPE